MPDAQGMRCCRKEVHVALRLPTIQGIIRRRILVNFRVDPQCAQRQLPPRFRPKLQNGQAVAGICLIRLEQIRPKMFPQIAGMASENAAHRIAVMWEDEQGETLEGVFIPRRDTDSRISHLLGGRVFPGEHQQASFDVNEVDEEISFSMRSSDGDVAISLVGKVSDEMPSTSIFPTLADASAFFESGSLGYSVTGDSNRLDGIKLQTEEWKVTPLEVREVYSSYFADESKFPKGSALFDHALLMRDIKHEWHGASDLYF